MNKQHVWIEKTYSSYECMRCTRNVLIQTRYLYINKPNVIRGLHEDLAKEHICALYIASIYLEKSSLRWEYNLYRQNKYDLLSVYISFWMKDHIRLKLWIKPNLYWNPLVTNDKDTMPNMKTNVKCSIWIRINFACEWRENECFFLSIQMNGETLKLIINSQANRHIA